MSARFKTLAAASALALVAATASAKQNSCDDPILIGTTISLTGALASLTSLMTNVTIALTTGLVGAFGAAAIRIERVADPALDRALLVLVSG